MNLRMTAGLGLTVSLLTLTAANAAELKVGDKAPDFKLTGSDGKTYSLADFRGKEPVVLAWFPKAFTGGCTKQCKSYAAGASELKPLHVAYFTASVDDAETNARFAQSLNADFPILSDPTKATAEAYGVLGTNRMAKRWTFYIDRDGTIREIDKTINTDNAAPDTAAKLKSLGLAGR
jgi:peroxiredoxin Q/BCP